jgi:hypothetical protein
MNAADFGPQLSIRKLSVKVRLITRSNSYGKVSLSSEKSLLFQAIIFTEKSGLLGDASESLCLIRQTFRYIFGTVYVMSKV